MKPEDDDPFLQDQEKSKTRLKQEAREITKLGASLAKLSEKRLLALNLDSDVLHAVHELKKMKHSDQAKKRQTQYLGKLLRKTDIEKIQQDIAEYEIVRESHARYAEDCGKRLLQSDDSVLHEFVVQHPELDQQKLRQLVRQARKNLARENPLAEDQSHAQPLLTYLKQTLTQSR